MYQSKNNMLYVNICKYLVFLARYHQDYDTLGVKSTSLSQRYYHQALALLPDIGIIFLLEGKR